VSVATPLPYRFITVSARKVIHLLGLALASFGRSCAEPTDADAACSARLNAQSFGRPAMCYATVALGVLLAMELARSDAALAADDGALSVSLPSATFEYQNDHRALVAKADDWHDPTRPEDRRLVADGSARALVPGKQVEIPLASVTWGSAVRARVRVSAKDCGRVFPTLEAKANSPWLAFVAEGPGRLEEDGTCIFALAAREPLPHAIGELEGEVQWTMKTGRRRVGLGRSHHALLITAGPPQRAQAWAMTGVGTVPPRPDHNACRIQAVRGLDVGQPRCGLTLYLAS
jgi:hypothetical protein